MTTQQKRPTTQRRHTRSTTKKQDNLLDRGMSFIDPADGKRLNVRARDIKGKHDRVLVAAVGVDFMGLLGEMQRRQGLDLLAAMIWIGRVVNGRDDLTYEDILDELGYDDLEGYDFEQPKTEDDGPEA